MNKCENNPELVQRLANIYSDEEMYKYEEYYKTRDEILSRVEDIKLVLFSLDNCTNANINIGNKCRISVNTLLDTVNNLR